MGSSTVAKTVAKQLKYYFDVRRLEDGFDLTNHKTPDLGRPTQRARPTLQYQGLHDRALKHYFSQPQVRAQLTRLEPERTESEEHSPRERQIRKSLRNSMKKYQFGRSHVPEWYYIYTLGGPRQQQYSTDCRATSAKPRKAKAVKAGWPVVRHAPGPEVPPDEEERLVNNASRIITNTELTGRAQQPRARTAVQRYPLRPVEKPRGEGRPRPLTSKYTWDSNGYRLPSAKVKAYDDSHLDKAPRRAYLRRPQSSPRRAQHKTGGESASPDSPSPSPRNRQGSLVSASAEHSDDEADGETAEGQPAEYQVTVRTGNCIGASTTAAVYLTLYGDRGHSPALHLEVSQHSKVKFQRGKEDLFVLKTPHVGQLNRMKIGHHKRELSYAWFLDTLTIRDVREEQTFQFTCQRWLSGQDEDRHTHCTFVIRPGEADTEKSDTRPPSDTKGNSKTLEPNARSAPQSKDTGGGGRRQPSGKQASGSTTAPSRLSQSTRPRAQKKGGDARGQDVAPSQTPGKGRSAKSSVSSQDKRGKNQKPQPVDQDYLAGYKAGLEAVEEAERQRREEERAQSQQLLTGTSLHDACHSADLQRITLLLHNFPQMIHSRDENGWTPLHIAASSGQMEVIRRLTSAGCDDLDVDTPTGYTPTHLAAMNGHSSAIKILNAMGASMDCKTVDQQTPLHLASSAGHLECVKCLVANGVEVMAEDGFSRTALALAEQCGQQEVVLFLQRCQTELADPGSTFALMHHSQDTGGSPTAVQAAAQQSQKDSQQPEGGPGARPMTSTQRKKEKEKKELEEKREQYEEQHRHMEQEGVSFLDLIRQEMEGEA